GPGYTLDGKFYLEVNTTGASHTVTRAAVDRTDGSLSGSTSFSLPGHTVRIGVAGSIDFAASSLFSIHGYAELSFAITGLDVAFDAGFHFLTADATVTGAGAIRAGTLGGIVLDLQIKLGSDTTPNFTGLAGFDLSGSFRLQLNTRPSSSNDLLGLSGQT